MTDTVTTAQPCKDCGAPTRRAFPGTDNYRTCTYCGHVQPWDAPSVVYATDRAETDSCEASTPGCAVDHTRSAPGVSCEGW